MEAIGVDLRTGFSRRRLFDVWRSCNEDSRNDAVYNYILNNSDQEGLSEVDIANVRKVVANFCGQKCRRDLMKFKHQHTLWLDGKLMFACLPSIPGPSRSPQPHAGRPTKDFSECNESTKRRKVQNLLEKSQDELFMATQIKLRAEGKRDAAKLVNMALDPNNSPKRATKLKKMITLSIQNLPIKMTKEKALAVYIDNKMTKDQYIDIRQINKEHNANIYPSYFNLLKAKKDCYPQDIVITEVSGEIPLQSLIDHTVNRLVTAQKEVIESRKDTIDPSLIYLTFKWGCDGASGQSRYKQIFESEECDDSFLFVISLVPLRMQARSRDNTTQIILWQNQTPSSTKFCRPIKIVFHKETPDFIRQEVDNIRNQIDNLVPTNVEFEGPSMYVINSKLILSMVDGKACSSIANKAGQNCHLCGATPKTMNNLNQVKARPVDRELLTLGISSLHAWIKCFECLIHIAYRLETKSWQIKQADKDRVNLRKSQIQTRFRREMGLLVDMPKQGYGSTNDGNTARGFFSDAEKSAEITGINVDLIKRFGIILRTIACGFPVNVDAFEQYCFETAHLYVDLYPWYYMPQSVHKILTHGESIIKAAELPIGQLSEEAQEARNKDARRYREFHTRKFSRKQTMEDMLHMLLISSDPLISSLRRGRPKQSGTLPSEVLALLTAEASVITENESGDDDD